MSSTVLYLQYPVEALLRVDPFPGFIPHKLGPSIVVSARPPGVHAEINGSTSTQSFASTTVDVSPGEPGLWYCLVSPLIARGSHESPMPFAIGLESSILIGSTSIDEQYGELWQGIRQA